MSDVDDFLSHYGVKGMKWGQRKSREQRQADRVAKIKAKGQKKLARERSINKGNEYFRSGKAMEDKVKAKGMKKEAKARGNKKLAKKIVAQQKLKNYSQLKNSSQARNGAEFAALTLASGGGYNVARAGISYQVRRQTKRVEKFS